MHAKSWRHEVDLRLQKANDSLVQARHAMTASANRKPKERGDGGPLMMGLV